MCDIWKTRDQKKIGVREMLPQLESIRRLGVRWIVFSGGEPLMNSELPELCGLLTFYRWKKKYTGLEVDQVRQLKQMGEENVRLKRIVADLTLDKAMLQDVLRKKF